MLERNFAAVDAALAALHEVEVPAEAGERRHVRRAVPAERPTSSSASRPRCSPGAATCCRSARSRSTARSRPAPRSWEKRDIAEEIPVWDPAICIHCTKCALVCPHAAIRLKVYDPDALAGAPDGFKSKEWQSTRAARTAA